MDSGYEIEGWLTGRGDSYLFKMRISEYVGLLGANIGMQFSVTTANEIALSVFCKYFFYEKISTATMQHKMPLYYFVSFGLLT